MKRLLLPALLALTAVLGTASVGSPTAGSSTGATESVAASSFKVQKAKVPNGGSVVARWNPCQARVTYKVNASGFPKARRASLISQVKQGVAKISALNGVKYTYGGTTTFVPKTTNIARQPAELVIAAVPKSKSDFDFSGTELGYGGTLWAAWSRSGKGGAAVMRGYVVLESTRAAYLKNGYGKGATLGNLILHELGHATGLEHVSAKNEIMNPVLSNSTPNGYGTGDRTALKKYGKAAGCISVPSGVQPADLS